MAKLIEQQHSDSTDPVDILLMAHAMLATNKNNESFALFVSVNDPRELAAWAEWTDSFRNQHTQAPVSHYLFNVHIINILFRNKLTYAETSPSNRDLRFRSALVVLGAQNALCRSGGRRIAG